MAVRFFRLRFLLRMTEPARLHPHHAGVLYALLAASNAEGSAGAALPEGFMLEAPEQCRTELAPGDEYAFGVTVVASEPTHVRDRLIRVAAGLRAIGRRPRARSGFGKPFEGNFDVVAIQDLVAARDWAPVSPPSEVPVERIEAEISALGPLRSITLRFVSPLRLRRPASARSEGHGYMDRAYFDPSRLVGQLFDRLRGLGVGLAPNGSGGCPAVAESNRLVWLDLEYGPDGRRKSLGGAVGRVRFEVDAAAKAALVWGQYARAGEGTRFGFGRYRIEELGPEPWECRRSSSLLQLALSGRRVDRVAEEFALESGRLEAACERLRAGRYEPPEPHRFRVDTGGRERELSVPPPTDRALQRLVHDLIAPGLDAFFEASSLAYRRGLGRVRAARRLQDAVRRGFRWAIKSDFARFFDTVDHELLGERLEAFLADAETVRAVMSWVRRGAPSPGRGLPTGSPLSPLLGNLFLDVFDEEVSRSGGFLVRYADDFMILARERERLDHLFNAAKGASEALLLELNAAKTRSVDLGQPFTFLGFRFERVREWTASAEGVPAAVEDLGWREADRAPAGDRRRVTLPGEVPEEPPDLCGTTLVVGPGVSRIRVRGERLLCDYADTRRDGAFPRTAIREILLLGQASLDTGLLHAICRDDASLVLMDESGWVFGAVEPYGGRDDADLIDAQARAARDPALRLAVSRRLVAAKIRNYASLADARGAGNEPSDGGALRELAARAEEAASTESLLGMEGGAASLWYSRLDGRLEGDFRFERRVAPHASDPINVLLNLAQTVIHRECVVALRLAGFTPSLGILHRPRIGHAALASDIQEPFRHLADRIVIDVAAELRPADFERRSDEEGGTEKLRLRWDAAREFVRRLQELLCLSCLGAGQSEARTYRQQIHWQARALRHLLLEPRHRMEVFAHP